MQNTTNNPTIEQMADALDMVKRLRDIVSAYAPEYVYGAPKAKVLKAAHLLLTDLAEFTPPKSFKFDSMGDFIAHSPGRYHF